MSGTEQEAILGTRPKPFVFVLMPFEDKFTDVYQFGIKQACEKAEAYAERLDEQIFTESMLQRIYNQIAKADVVIADMTGRNPNVFYEVGYAHALGKVVVLLTQDKDDIPFDLKHYRHIIYENATGLSPQLETTVRWAIKQASERTVPLKLPVAIYCNDKALVDAPTIDVVPEAAIPFHVQIGLNITCANTDEVKGVNFSMALWTSDKCVQCDWLFQRESCHPIHRPEGGVVFNLPSTFSLLPGEWDSVHAGIRVRIDAECQDSVVESVTLRICTLSGSYDFPFTIKISKSSLQAPA
jgi:hypothetical protein